MSVKRGLQSVTLLGLLLLFILMVNKFSNSNIFDEDSPTTDFPYEYNINGVYYPKTVEIMDFNNKTIADYDSFITEIGQFENVKKIEVCGTNLSYEQLENLQNTYPDIKFVWTITLANTWTVRTDVVAFSTNKAHHNPAIKNDEVWKLKYLTDIVALDIGHNEISDLSFLQYMPNLKVLIIADNWISDLSPIVNCKKLMYLETFVNPIRDISPLAELDNLVDINVSYNYFTDYTPLLNKPKLERLWITHTSMTSDSIQQLIDAYPNVTMDYTSGTSVQGGWRDHPRYFAFREMFATNTVNDLFKDEDETSTETVTEETTTETLLDESK